MSAPQHTPGPWQSFPSVSRVRPFVIDTAIGTDSTNGTVIAEVPRGKQGQANANLIAAAPDLYEALMLVSRNSGKLSHMDWQQVERALARARGEQP